MDNNINNSSVVDTYKGQPHHVKEHYQVPSDRFLSVRLGKATIPFDDYNVESDDAVHLFNDGSFVGNLGAGSAEEFLAQLWQVNVKGYKDTVIITPTTDKKPS